MYKFLAVILVVLVVSSAATNVKKCKKGQPFPLSVNVEGCAKAPCKVVKGATAAMDVHFVGTKDNINSLKAIVQATAVGVTAPYDLPEDVADVCQNLSDGATCPINEGEDAVYNFKLYVQPFYPSIPVSVEVSLNDENNVSIACFVVDIRVGK